ncbi:GFA family protein [Roseibium sp. Sym1]|uniref:GFA family protein n=1 Tax=Roseibium sp. Sym1 TaxID=3016006 RepID=UPI0022B3B5B3|nr:GFA family protein [Roseibium sp. Sym1]
MTQSDTADTAGANTQPETIQGGCLCGQVSFQIENRFDKLLLCHCAQCRKTTGSAHASNLLGRAETLVFLEGADQVREFRHPERDFTKAFCSRCGGALPYVTGDGSTCIVPAGALNAEPEVAELDNIFSEEQPGWSEQVSAAPRHVGFGSVFD